ncbi:bifunctional nuclease domain-containing protein [Spirillospora sp. CA-255316]
MKALLTERPAGVHGVAPPALRVLTTHAPGDPPRQVSASRYHVHLPPDPTKSQLDEAVRSLLGPPDGLAAPVTASRPVRGPTHRMDLVGVRIEIPSNKPVVVLKERGGVRYLPIWITAAEATAIAYAQHGTSLDRPLTHNLLREILRTIGTRISATMIAHSAEAGFFCMLILSNDVRVRGREAEYLDEVGVLSPDEEEAPTN